MVNRGNDDAVSPVIGVMLMVVVTIIIAATVSIFSTGFVSETHTAPQTQVEYVGVLAGQEGELGEIGLVFENKGGETLLLSDLELLLKSTMSKNETSIAYTDAPSSKYFGVSVPGEARLSIDFPSRMKKIGVTGSATTVANSRVKAGDRFVIHADRYFSKDESKHGWVMYVADRERLEGTPYSSDEFEVSSRTAYTLIDKNTGATIASGTLVGSVL